MAKHLPFSAPRKRSLPTINPKDTAGTLQNWKVKLQKAVKNSLPAPTPYNFAVTSVRGGLKLTWAPVQTPADKALGSPDGYEILKSPSGSFTDDLQIVPIKDVAQASYFDSTDGNSQTCHYRIRTTSGTSSNPQSVRGPESGVVSHTSIDSNDTKTISTTVLDTFTTSKTRSNARRGNYGLDSAFRTSLGTVGGSGNAAGAASSSGGSGSGGGSGSSGGSVSFDEIQSGINTSAQMIVSGAASIIPDPDDPGEIDATTIQGVPVDATPPDHNGELLIYDSASGTYIPGDPLVQGIEPVGQIPSTNPVQIGGIDESNIIREVRTDSYGGLRAPRSEELLRLILAELRAIKMAIVSLDPTSNPSDYAADQFLENDPAKE